VTISTSEPIPKAKLSAYQRWELASLEDGPAAEHAPGPSDADAAVARDAVLREARDAGYAAGIAAAAAERARLDALLATLSAAATDHEQRLVDEVLDLALVLARQIIGEALAVRREFVLPVVSAALRQLPHATQRIELVLNPADAALVQTLLASADEASRTRIVADATIAPGGCRIETEQCEIDITLPMRWRRLLSALGRSDDWLEPA
jgi:flagellar assembly protein FliH